VTLVIDTLGLTGTVQSFSIGTKKVVNISSSSRSPTLTDGPRDLTQAIPAVKDR
jgi:hypothetical protein